MKIRVLFLVSLLLTMVLSANAQTLSVSRQVDEGESAVQYFFIQDQDLNSIESNIGEITFQPESNTLRWAYDTDDGPADSQTVVILVLNANGVQINRFLVDLTVDNVAPEATFVVNPATNDSLTANLNLLNPTEPSNADTDAGFLYTFDCDMATAPFDVHLVTTSNHTCAYPTSGTYTVMGRIYDIDGDFTQYETEISFNEPVDDGANDIPNDQPSMTEVPYSTEMPNSTPEASNSNIDQSHDCDPQNNQSCVNSEITTGNDADADGMPDAIDICPWRGNEDGLGIDSTGCPYYDFDRDGILNRFDNCPNRGNEYGFGIDSDGCPIGEGYHE